MSLVGPLVTPNRIETRFDRMALYIPTLKHPVVVGTLVTLLVLAGGAGLAIATHALPLSACLSRL